MHHTAPPRSRPEALRRGAAWCVLGAFVATLPGAPAFAELVGEQVKHGKAEFERNGKNTKITTKTRQTIIDYDRFDIEHDESVRIDQPSAKSRVLNRVPRSTDASRIDGGLSSNGIVYILNPAGVFIGDRAVVDVSGLVAGAAHLSDKDFLRRVDRFTDVTGDVGVAAGAKIRSAGNVSLIGRHVENLGAIESRSGTIALVAGDDVVLAPLDGNVLVRVDGGQPESDVEQARFGVEQGGELSAQRVVLAAGDHYSLAMNHDGVTRAKEIHVQAGEDGLAQIAGTLDASDRTPGKRGGRIEVRAGKIALLRSTLDASGAAGGGEILVGGDVRGSGEGQRARRIYVAPDAELNADAIENGDGGRIVIYADEHTGFFGELSARGGAQGGNGGFAEISGARLEARGDVDLGAPQGEAGTLLYDPNVIQIRGNQDVPADDGNDLEETPTTVVGNDGTAGRILSSDPGDGEGGGSEADPFVIFESEIEGTDANIILEAVDYITAVGDFIGDAVTLKSGRSLTLRTTANAPNSEPSAPLGIDLVTNTVEQKNLAWEVSNGANILLETNLDITNDNTGREAPILAGKLISSGAAYETEPGEGRTVLLPAGGDPRTVTLDAERGRIEVAQIQIDGDPSQAGVGDDPARTTSNGGAVTITNDQGDITVGRDDLTEDEAILARGGNAVAASPSFGGSGGGVLIEADNGSVKVEGDIDVSGGVGQGVFLQDGAPVRVVITTDGRVVSSGGISGDITIDAAGSGSNGNIEIDGRLIAKGGAGKPIDGSAVDPDLDDVFDAVGGPGGQINVGADVNLVVNQKSDDPLRPEIDASGGDGSAAGGSTNSGVGQGAKLAIQLIGARSSTTAGEVTIQPGVDLVAKGGESGVDFAGAPASPTGGQAGSGGAVTVAANNGKLTAAGMRIDASGGVGRRTLDPLSHLPRTNAGLALNTSGQGGTVIVRAKGDVDSGEIVSQGGDATNGNALGGGNVTVTSGEGNIFLGRIDVSGGSATSEALTDGVALNGGAGATITVGSSATPTEENPNPPGIGDITLRADVGGNGGTGVDKEGEQTFADGSTVDVNADPDDGVISMAAGALDDARFYGRNVALEAWQIGSAGDETRVRVGGTRKDNDTATFTAFDQAHGEIFETPAAQLENLGMVMRKETAHAHLHRADNSEVLRSAGAVGTTTPNTLEFMQTNDDDPRLGYRLLITPTGNDPQPALAIASGAVDLGREGGEIANGGFPTSTQSAPNRGDILGVGAGTHVASRGNVLIEGRALGSDATPLQFDGDPGDADHPGAVLTLDANGSIDGKLVGGANRFGALEIVQHDAANGHANIDDLAVAGANEIEVVGTDGTNNTPPVNRIVRADTSGGGGSGFSYRLQPDTQDATLEVDQVVLGGTGLLQSLTGDVVLSDAAQTAITTNGNSLTLLAGDEIKQESATTTEIAMGGGGTSAPGALIFIAQDFGSDGAPIRTSGVKQLAGAATDGGVFLENQSSDVSIQTVFNADPVDTGDVAGQDDPDDEDALQDITASGVRAGNGDLEIRNANGRIVLGKLGDGPAEFGAAHVVATGDVTLAATGATPDTVGSLEIDNARFIKTPVPVIGDIFTPVNDALIRSEGGDVTIDAKIDTAAGATAHSDAPGAPDDTFVHASLRVDAPKGTTNLGGDVGTRDADGRLALLDTTSAALTGDRTMNVGSAHFRGGLDGPGALTLTASDLPGQATDHLASVQFDGDVGAGGRLGGLTVDAEQITFTGADRVVTGAGGVDLSTNQTGIPTVGTIRDTGGGLRIQTDGDVAIGDADHIDKLSSVGPLAISAGGTVRVADLSATRISVEGQQIEIIARAPGDVLQKDGTTVPDTGTDWVGNEIRMNRVPVAVDVDPGDAAPQLGVGSGGITAPGSLQNFVVRRFTPDFKAVDASDLQGPNGEVLDLRPTGGNLVGNPAEDLPRERPTPDPELQGRETGMQPTPAPMLSADQVLAYLRCGEPSAPSASCEADDLGTLAGVSNWQQSTLATERAAELAAKYREMRQRDLSAVFAEAGSGFRAESGFGEFDAESFARYLESGAQPEARAAIHQLAELMVGVELLGLAPDQSERVRRELAGQLAAEADLPGFDTDAVLAAVAATPIEMPPDDLESTR